MKIRKDGTLFTLTESDLKKIVKKQMLNESMLNDNAKETKNSKIEAIIKQLRRLSNTLDSTDNMKPSKINELLHKIENGVMERLEEIQDLLVKQAEEVKEVKK
jgi:divalent metal cation (Fe/Co/Zn/Cd) transporter